MANWGDKNEGKQAEEPKVSQSPIHCPHPAITILQSSQILQTISKNKNGLPEKVDENTPITVNSLLSSCMGT